MALPSWFQVSMLCQFHGQFLKCILNRKQSFILPPWIFVVVNAAQSAHVTGLAGQADDFDLREQGVNGEQATIWQTDFVDSSFKSWHDINAMNLDKFFRWLLCPNLQETLGTPAKQNNPLKCYDIQSLIVTCQSKLPMSWTSQPKHKDIVGGDCSFSFELGLPDRCLQQSS